MCNCPEKKTDGLPPCGKAIGHKRPDGWYCDCGHEVDCCAETVRQGSREASRSRVKMAGS